MKLLDILKKYVIPSVLTTISIDSYRRQIVAHSQELDKLELNKNEVIQQIQNELWSDKIINSEFKNKLEASSGRLSEVEDTLKTLKIKLDIVNSKINNNDFTTGETKEILITNQKYLGNELNKLEEIKNSSVKELQDIINNSDISSYISDLLDSYRNFIDLLGSDQLVALTNILGYTMILFTLFSISVILIGDYLIDNFKLELRFPKLAKLIRIKQKINKHYLFFNILIFYIITISFIIINIYMILLKYFI
jgi:archaellum component FlaC